MKFDLGVSYKQQQKLVMTEQMKMSINILQMSSYDLREYIDKEYEENPIIECIYEENNISYEGAVKENNIRNTNEHTNESNGITEENMISLKEKTLKDFLYEQMRDMKLSEDKKYIISYIIESLDEKGYLEEGVEYISEVLNVDLYEVIDCLEIFQGFEPAGIGAKDLKSCLKLQISKMEKLELESKKKIYKIIDNYLEEVAEVRTKNICSKEGMKKEEVEKYFNIIKELRPNPSSGFYTGDEIKYIIPDAEIIKENNKYLVIMNEGIIPKISINENLIKSFLQEDNQLNKYIKENTIKASILIKSIEERKNTLLRILEMLVEEQKEFLKYGEKYLKPLTLKDVSKTLHLHESTISRAVKDKYVRTSYGTFKIRDFFQTAKFLDEANNRELGQEYIKAYIRAIIKEEDSKHPRSDQEISNILLEKQVNISRRTVAKYREQMGIVASKKRKNK